MKKLITKRQLFLKHSIPQIQTPRLLGSILSMLLLLSSAEVFAADYGDAPASYGSPSHTAAGSLKLGVNAGDDEGAAQPNATATGDDITGTDDEDGVSVFPALYASGTSYFIPAANISATGTGTLHAWVDFDKNGLFSASEYKSVAVTAGVLASPLHWTAVTVGAAGTSYARFRFTSSTLTDTAATTTVDERATMAAADGEVEDYLLTITASSPINCGTETPGSGSGYATGGTGLYRNSIFWLDWSCGAVTQFTPGALVSKSWDLGNGVIVSATISNLTAAVSPYNTGSWGGDTLDDLYSGLNPLGLSNTVPSVDPDYDISFSMTLNGNTLPMHIVTAEAEDTGAWNESLTWTTDGDSWRIIDREGSFLDVRFSNAGKTLYMDDQPNGNRGGIVALSDNVSSLHVSMQAGGTQALAFGVFSPFDHGDAQGFSAEGGHFMRPTGTGGSQPTTLTNITSLTLATVNEDPIIYLGANKGDSESVAQPNAAATGDDTSRTDDEDGISAFPALYASGSSYFIPAANVTATGTGTLHAWVDFDKNGAFTASEYKSVAVTSGVLAGPLQWTGITVGSAGTTYARFRFTSSTLTDTAATTTVDERATMAAANGEMEDYALPITTAPSFVPPAVHSQCVPSANWKQITLNNALTGSSSHGVIATGSYAGSASIIGDHANPRIFDLGSSEYTYGTNLLPLTATYVYFGSNAIAPESVSWSFSGEPMHELRLHFNSLDATRLAFQDSSNPGIGWEILSNVRTNNTDVGYDFNLGDNDIANRDNSFADAEANGTSGGFSADGTIRFYSLSSAPITQLNLQFITQPGVAALEGKYYALEACASLKDHGDAPAGYGDPTHIVSGSLKLGTNAPDIETVATPNATATGDDTIGTDDEDGVSAFPILYAGETSYLLPAANLSATGTGTLHAWIDFDKNGSFSASEYKSVAVTAGVLAVPLQWTGITVGSAGTTYARFRFTSTALTDNAGTTALDERATLLANDGEVEDYSLSIQANLVYPASSSASSCPADTASSFAMDNQVGWNHGGTPDGYAPTLQSSDINSAQAVVAGPGISYLIDTSTARILGANQTGRLAAYQVGDYAQYSFKTSASINPGRFMKYLRYGVMSSASIHTPYKISALISSDPSFTTASLVINSHTVTAPAFGYIQTVVPLEELVYLQPSTTYYVRIIFHDVTSSSGELRWDDLVFSFANCWDYGDAPTSGSSYGISSHAVTNGGNTLSIGTGVDAEAAAWVSTNAEGDNLSGVNDENSLSSFPSLSTSSRQYSLSLPVSNASGSTARLVGWIDFNRNGAFDTNEAATINVANGANNKTIGLTWKNLPSTMQTGTTYLRLRLTTDPSIATGTASTSQATGLAFDGEVEDYALTISNGGVSVSGTVYHDLNVDGTQQTEPGIGQVTIVLYDNTNNTCRSTQTNAQGQYRFDQVAAGNYTVYEAAAEALPQPNTCPPVGADLNAYLSSTPNNQALTVSTASINGLDFADVQKPQFTLEHSQTTLPGATVTYPHRFTALADGTVSFSLADGADPANLTWDVVLYVDTNCNAALEGGDTELNSAFLMTAGQSLCLIAKVLAPSNVSSGASHILEITSSFTFGDGSRISTPVTQTRTDLTRTSAGSPTGGSVDGAGKLKLSKAVWNVSRNIQGDVALPGETLRYLISYENIGNGSLDELAVQDRVPEFTSLTGLPQCGTTPPELTLCSPTVGGLDLEWVFTGKLLPGSRGQVFYEVLVE